MTPQQQDAFAAHLRARLPKPPGEKWHKLYAFTEFSARVLGRHVTHWRGLSLEDARAVMREAGKLSG